MQQLLGEAVRLHQSGDLDAAEQCYRRVLAENPDALPALYFGGVAALQRGEPDQARQRLSRLTELDPQRAEVWYHLGLAEERLQHREAAAQAYRRSLAVNAGFAPAANNLGLILDAAGRAGEALEFFHRAVTADGQSAEYWCNFGMALHQVGRTTDAIAALQRADALAPGDFGVLLNLGSALADAGDLQAAVMRLEAAARTPQGDAGRAYANLGTILHDFERHEDAMQAYRRALEADPNNGRARFNLAALLQERGEETEARALFADHAARTGSRGAQVRLATLLPQVVDSESEVSGLRRELLADIDRLRDERFIIADPVEEIGEAPFYISYHGRDDDRAVLGGLAAAYRQFSPELNFVAPHCREPRRAADGRRIRIGFLSAHFYDHSVGKTVRALIVGLPRDRFEVHLLRVPPQHRDGVADALCQAAQRTHDLPRSLSAARDLIAGLELDLLFYPDVGTEPLSYFLPYMRLAPVQCTTWGHPTTSGIDTVDYYLSHVLLDPPGNERYYSERLVRIARGAVYPGYPMPTLPQQPRSRRELGLPEGIPLFICPQAVFKLAPVFDATLAVILDRCPDALLLVPESSQAALTDRLRQRWQRSIPGHDRIRFVHRRGLADFCNLIDVCDVMLDPFPVGGGVTTFDALWLGIPLVTLAGPLLRGRFATACLTQLDVTDLIAGNEAGYVDLAVHLAEDSALRQSIRTRLRAAAGRLYGDLEALPEYVKFFEAAVAG